MSGDASAESRPSVHEIPARKATMEDVARLAGVAIKTVSRVVNGEPHVAVNTADRVRAAIVTLDYEPDMTAVNLRRRATEPRSQHQERVTSPTQPRVTQQE